MPDTPVDPFGATVDGVLALVPEARLVDTPVPPGQYGVTAGQVEAWLVELSAAVAMRLDDWQTLTVVPRPPETTSDRDQLVAFARTIVHNGAASYLEAARFPERASTTDTSYAAVLWARYRDGLDVLTGWLTRRLAITATGDAGPTTATGVDYAFPPATFVDRFGV